MKTEYDIINEFPRDLSELKYTEIQKAFPKPTLIHLEGQKKEPLFLSTCLHGNEDVGFETLKKFQTYLKTHSLPRSLSIFVGNVEAATLGLRRKEGQKDYNRIWRKDNSPEGKMAQEIIETMKNKNVFASIDLHNNTGKNPLYACINSLEKPYLQLASLFSHNIVFFDNPNTCQSMAFAPICPAVTVECGQTGNSFGPEKAFEFLVDVLHLETLEPTQRSLDNLTIYQTLGRISVEGTRSISFGNEEGEIAFPHELELWNFKPLKANTLLAKSKSPKDLIFVRDESDRDITSKHVKVVKKDGTQYFFIQDCVPAMLTSDLDIIYKDCLGYVMTEINP